MDQLARHINELRFQLEWYYNTAETMGLWSDALRVRCERCLVVLNQPTIQWPDLIVDLRAVMHEAPFADQAPQAWYFAMGLSTCLDTSAPQYWNADFKTKFYELTREMADLMNARRAEAAAAQGCWLRTTALNQAAVAVFGLHGFPGQVRH